MLCPVGDEVRPVGGGGVKLKNYKMQNSDLIFRIL